MIRIALVFLLMLLITVSCEESDKWELFNPDFEVTVLLPREGLGDRGFVDVVYEGIENSVKDINFKVNYIVPDNEAYAEKWIAAIPEYQVPSGLESLIIIAGNQYSASVDSLKGNFGIHKILLLAGKGSEQTGLASVIYRSYAPSYIGGYLSASLCKPCRAVVVAAFDAPFLKEYIDGFRLGVADAGGVVNPSVFLSTDFHGFSMPDSAYTISKALLRGNDLIFALATGSNLGIVNAARDFHDRKYVVGIDSDQSWMGLTVISGSVVARFGKDIDEYIRNFSQRKFQSGSFIKTLEDGRTGFLINKRVLVNTEIPDWLNKKAIQLEKKYFSEFEKK